MLPCHIHPLRRFFSGLLAAAVLVSQLTFPPLADASHLGSSTASAGAAPPPAASAVQSFQPDLFTGRATTGIPIALPPGRKGMQPSVGLSYSSSGRNGWVGVGWSLDVGYIEHNTKNGVPKYDSSDTFTFLFQGVSSELISIPDGTYRAKDEGAFLRFENKGASGWEVKDKSGTKYLFGQTVSSQIESSGKVFRWALDKVIDVQGNSLTISYTKDLGQLYPSQILYTAHDPTNLAPANRVDFILESRSDVETSLRSGWKVTTAKRLKSIEAKATVNTVLSLARRYDLLYVSSFRSGRSLLTQVKQFGLDGTTTLPPALISYQHDPGAVTYQIQSGSGSSPSTVVGWNVRRATGSFGLSGCIHPYIGLPWEASVVDLSSVALGGCVGAGVAPDGSIDSGGCSDEFVHGWTWVYVNSARNISLNLTQTSANACLWHETNSGVQNIGSGNVSVSLSSGWSLIHVTGYNQGSDWNFQMTSPLKNLVDAMNPYQVPTPQLSGDVDGNATSDLISFDPSGGSWSVSLSTPPTFSSKTTWLTGFGTTASTPMLGDWNSDGKTDIALYDSNTGGWRFATSTGSSFDVDSISPITFNKGTPFSGDFNGDGLTDLGTYSSNADWTIALGSGTGFSISSAFNLHWGASTMPPLTGDFNGDGLTDIAITDPVTGQVQPNLSKGSGYSTEGLWINGFGINQSYSSADINGDGLSDVLYYDKSTGQVKYALSNGSSFGSSQTLAPTFSLRSTNDSLQIADFNGDSVADPAIFSSLNGQSEIALSRGQATDLLSQIDNGLGASTTIQYQRSTELSNTKLPFVTPVVQQATVSDGMGHSYTTTYTYTGGLYDSPTKEFRGFGHVEVRDAVATVSITEFLQDQHKKGRPYRSEVRDASGNLWSKSEQSWSCTEPYAGVHFVKLDSTDAYLYDGDATFKQTRARLQYDSFGNLTRSDEDGEVGVVGDERASTTSYVTDTAAWILGKPSITQTLDSQGTVLAQRRFFYDGATSHLTSPTAGLLTKEESWLNLPTPQWLATSLTYDAYGNVKTVTDSLGRITTNTFDSTGTFLTRAANTLGHTRQLTYDSRTGAVLTSTDANGQVGTTEYDTLGRVTKVIGPLDTSALPTLRYEYDLTTLPLKTTVHARIQSGQTSELTSYAFTDALGRAIQTRSPAEDSTKQVVSGAVELDSLGRVVKQWTSYLDAVSTSYVPHTTVSGLAPPVTYTYDAVGRVLTTRDPDGSVTRAQYDDWQVTGTDANAHQTRRTSDSFGRLAQVEEFNTGQIYTTTYAYDTLNNLISVRDHAGNVTAATYDSLGRKLEMSDPDMGAWTYAYDSVDNLTSQSDARGVVISFTYDSLNRLTQKTYSNQQSAVSYQYDNSTKQYSKGKLTEITDGSGSSSFSYDALGRLIKEEKTISGTTYTVQRSYDLLGRLVNLTYPDTDVATYTYNPQGGIETINWQSAISSQQSAIVTDVTYNAAGQITKIAYGNGVVSDYAYDPQTLRLSSLVTRGSQANIQDFSYVFDPVGNVSAITDRVHSSSQSFQYDDLNRLTSAYGSYGNFSYAYDALGNMLDKEGSLMTYGLPDGSKPHAVTSTSTGATLQYDANGNLILKSPSSSSLEPMAQFFSYDAENRLVEAKSPQQHTVNLTFQPGWNFFSLPIIPDNSSISTLFTNFTTDFEQLAAYNSSTSTFTHYVGDSEFDDFSTLEYGIGYQLYCKNPSGVTVTITGKLPTQQQATTLQPGKYLLPALSTQQTPLSQAFAGIDYEYVLRYDTATSSLTSATTADPGEAYYVKIRTASTWTPPAPSEVTTQFVYDGDGGRVKQITAAGTTTFLGQTYELHPDGLATKFIFAGSQRIASINTDPIVQASIREFSNQQSSASHQQEIVLAKAPRNFGSLIADCRSLIAAFLDALATWFNPYAEASVAVDIHYFHTDHLGSTNVVTDSTGTVVEVAEYSPYGSLANRSGSVNVEHKFTGQRADASTGLYFYNSRYYDPQLGRFTQPDSIVQAPADPQSLNRYSYVRNNPVNLVDPSGHSWFSKLMGAIAGVAVLILTGGTCIQCAMAAFNFTDTLIAARQAGVSWGRSLALAGTSAAIGFMTASAAPSLGMFAYAAGGALQGLTSAAILGGDIGHATWTGAVAGAVTWAAGPIIGGGVHAVLNDESFGRGAAEGAYGAAATIAIVAAATVRVSNSNSRTTSVAEAGQSGNPQKLTQPAAASNKPASSTPTPTDSGRGVGFGVVGSATGEAGLGPDQSLGGSASVGGGFAIGKGGPSVGLFGSNGGFVGGDGYHFAVGAFVSISRGYFGTNAGSISQLGGMARQQTVNIGLGASGISLQRTTSPTGIVTYSVTFRGPSLGISYSEYDAETTIAR